MTNKSFVLDPSIHKCKVCDCWYIGDTCNMCEAAIPTLPDIDAFIQVLEDLHKSKMAKIAERTNNG